MKNLYKIMFLTATITGSLVTISSTNWMTMWMGLEINLLSIIPLMSNTKNKMESEAAMKYFITQAMASTIFMLSIITMMNETISNIYLTQSIVMDSAMLTKMGAAPFHFWFPEVMEGLTLLNSLMMLTWQKIAPMIVFMTLPKSMIMMVFSIISSMLISGLMGLNQTSLRKILAYSSINHIGWMLGAMISNQSTWLIYMSIYIITTMIMIMTLNISKTLSMYQLINTMNKNKMMKLTFLMNFLSLGGIPPFIGFFPKWIIIFSMVEMKLYLMTLTMIISTVITLFIYMRITFTVLTLSTSETTKISTKLNKSTIMTLNLMTLSGMILCPIILTFM